jgi:hypothetical protein
VVIGQDDPGVFRIAEGADVHLISSIAEHR